MESMFEVGNYAVSVTLKVVAVVTFFLVTPIIAGYQEHKVMAFMQNRLGPMEAGPFGVLQLIADGIKFIQKENIVPDDADRTVFSAAPAVVMVPLLVMVAVLPLSPGGFAEDLDVGLFAALAISSVSVIGVVMASWSSASKYPLLGGVREIAQLLAYEIPLFLSAAAIVMQAETMSMVGIVEAQYHYTIAGFPVPYAIPHVVSLVLFGISALAELNRTPFDVPIADTEIIAGHMTEYSGLKYAFFMLSEFAGMVIYSVLITVMFFGGWYLWPGVSLPSHPFVANVTGFIITMVKTFGLVFVMTWLRSTFPRVREDQLQWFAWAVLLPASILNIAVVAVLKVTM